MVVRLHPINWSDNRSQTWTQKTIVDILVANICLQSIMLSRTLSHVFEFGDRNLPSLLGQVAHHFWQHCLSFKAPAREIFYCSKTLICFNFLWCSKSSIYYVCVRLSSQDKSPFLRTSEAEEEWTKIIWRHCWDKTFLWRTEIRLPLTVQLFFATPCWLYWSERWGMKPCSCSCSFSL